MDWSIVVNGAASAIGVIAAVVAIHFARRAASADARKAVDELAETVEHFTRLARKEQMRRVRGATAGTQAGSDPAAPPPELAVQTAAGPLTKEELRKVLLTRRTAH